MARKNSFKILAIETSCDETAAALVEASRGGLKILSNIVYSQIALHRKYRGIYPELASREHLVKILPVINKALSVSNQQPIASKIDYIAITTGPGLIGSLLVGLETARALSYLFGKPIIPVNHLEGHIYSSFGKANSKQSQFPLLALIVSGGHTMLVYMPSHLTYQVIGQTLDDAAGEAFDKVATLLGLPYPGGPAIEEAASKLKIENLKSKIKLPRPMIKSKDFNFSFSGLKTAVLYLVKNLKPSKLSLLKPQICGEFQQAVIDVLVTKTIQVAKKFRPKSICLCGGVGANKLLREIMAREIKRNFPSILFLKPPFSLCTDNAAMIGIVAGYKLLQGETKNWYDVSGDANLKL